MSQFKSSGCLNQLTNLSLYIFELGYFLQDDSSTTYLSAYPIMEGYYGPHSALRYEAWVQIFSLSSGD